MAFGLTVTSAFVGPDNLIREMSLSKNKRVDTEGWVFQEKLTSSQTFKEVNRGACLAFSKFRF